MENITEKRRRKLTRSLDPHSKTAILECGFQQIDHSPYSRHGFQSRAYSFRHISRVNDNDTGPWVIKAPKQSLL